MAQSNLISNAVPVTRTAGSVFDVSFGMYASVCLHMLLVVWLLLDGRFSPSQSDFEIQVTEVSIVPSEVFDVMQNNVAPEIKTQEEVLTPPQVIQTSPIPQPEENESPAVSAVAPETLPPPPRLDPPISPEIVPPLVADEAVSVSSDAPILPQDIPPPQEPPKLQPVNRVADETIAPPPPDVRTDIVRNAGVELSSEGETKREEQEATAPKASTAKIVTEAEQGNDPFVQTFRPQIRPQALPTIKETPPESEIDAQAKVETPASPTSTVAASIEDIIAQNQQQQPLLVSDAIEDAIAQSLQAADVPELPQALEPAPLALNAGELAAVMARLKECWNVGVLSSAALETTVFVSFEMTRDGRPIESSLSLDGFEGGIERDAQSAYLAAKRAILKCGNSGYNLPLEKYDLWAKMQIEFDPEKMRIK